MHQFHRTNGQQRGLFRRLGQHRVTGSKVRQDLAGEDSQREVPWRDTAHHTPGLAIVLVADAFVGVVHGKVDGFANFRHRIEQGFTGFTGGQRKQLVHMLFVQVTDFADHLGPLLRRYCRPLAEAVPGGVHGRMDVGFGGVGNMAHQVIRIGRVTHFHHFITGGFHRQHWAALPLMGFVPVTAGVNFRHRHRIGNVPTLGVTALVTEDLRRRHNGLAGNVMAQLHHHVDRVFGDLFRRNAGVDNLVYKGAVGPVFQQAAHQVRQQVFVGTNRSVDTARHLAVFQYLVVQRFTHTVQALELKLVPAQVFRQFQYRRHRVGVMGSKLRVNPIRHAQQLASAGQVRHVTAGLAGKHREAVQAHHLGALDLGIPVGAFYQSHHDAAVEFFRQGIQPVQGLGSPLREGLDHHAKAVPTFEFFV